jgi:hypothetical protein
VYDKKPSRNEPGCIVFLIDQSGSMADPISGADLPKSAMLTTAINDLLYELVLLCVKERDEGPRRYFDVAVLGYGGDGVRPVLESEPLKDRLVVGIDEIGRNPLMVETSEREGRQIRRPVWIRPAADGGTPMCEALNQAGAFIHGWVQQHPTSFPPIVLNITDGEATDGNPVEWAQRLQSLRTSDGPALVFNCALSSEGGAEQLYPAAADQVPTRFGQQLFTMSSPLPPMLANQARAKGFDVQEGSRGFVFNADIKSVVTFLSIGTGTASLLR